LCSFKFFERNKLVSGLLVPQKNFLFYSQKTTKMTAISMQTFFTTMVIMVVVGLASAKPRVAQSNNWLLSTDHPSATDEEIKLFRQRFARHTTDGEAFPDHAFQMSNYVPNAFHPSGFRAQSMRKYPILAQANKDLRGHFQVMDDEGNAYGRLGREAALELAKGARDAESAATLYDIPVFTGPTGGCEYYANGGPVPASVMRPVSFGRIHPVGFFTDSEASKEYFLLACPLLDRPLQNQVRVSRTWFKDIAAYKNHVYVEAVIELSIPEPAPGVPAFFFNHTHIGSFLMDNTSAICGYKVLFQRLEMRDPAPETQTDTALNNRIAVLCNNVVSACANASITSDDQYASISDCITFNSAPARKARNGYQYVDQDSLKCREFHYGLIVQNIARGLPEHQAKHCTHSGPRGGGKCVTHSFDSFFAETVTCQAQT
jgi:hypothetical protein